MLDRISGRYKVVVNHEEQYTVVPDGATLPRGTREVGKVGTANECLAYIEEVWTDMKLTDKQRIIDGLR